jgi:acetylglutamate kinase
MMAAVEKAKILVEALPYIKKFYGKTIVIKYGGHAMTNQALKQAVMTDVVLMKYVGMNPVLVHGGGPEINAFLERLGKKSSFFQGLRVTDRETMEVVEMVLVGKVNKEIVALLNQQGGKAVGLSGKDGGLIEAQKKYMATHSGEDGEADEVLDMGFVGEVARINPEIIETVIEKGYIPVVAPVGVGRDNESYNINADYVAGAIAVALKADKLILLTDVEGIYGCFGDSSTLLSSVRLEEIPSLINQGVISGGMIPKVQCCAQALQGGVSTAHIIDGRSSHSILLEIFTDQGIGTMVRQ